MTLKRKYLVAMHNAVIAINLTNGVAHSGNLPHGVARLAGHVHLAGERTKYLIVHAVSCHFIARNIFPHIYFFSAAGCGVGEQVKHNKGHERRGRARCYNFRAHFQSISDFTVPER